MSLRDVFIIRESSTPTNFDQATGLYRWSTKFPAIKRNVIPAKIWVEAMRDPQSIELTCTYDVGTKLWRARVWKTEGDDQEGPARPAAVVWQHDAPKFTPVDADQWKEVPRASRGQGKANTKHTKIDPEVGMAEWTTRVERFARRHRGADPVPTNSPTGRYNRGSQGGQDPQQYIGIPAVVYYDVQESGLTGIDCSWDPAKKEFKFQFSELKSKGVNDA